MDETALPIDPFTARQARLRGYDQDQLRELIDRGKLRRLLRGVYVSSLAVDSLSLRCSAVRLVVPHDAVVCDRTAAWLHGVDVFAFWELERPLPLEIAVDPALAPPRRQGVRSAKRALVKGDREIVHGISVTTRRRTAMDLGCKLRRHHAMASIDALLRLGGFTVTDMRAELVRFRRRRGVIQLRELIEVADPLSESPGESRLRLAIVDAGLPTPVSQYWVEVDGVLVFRLDLAYPRLKICIEFDGRQFHTTREDRERDDVRRAWLRAQGWRVIVVRSADLARPGPQKWQIGRAHV